MAVCECWQLRTLWSYAEAYELGLISAGDFAEMALGVL